MSAYPSELQVFPQWVCWKVEQRKGKATKIPTNPRTGKHASTTDPLTWGTFAEAIAGVLRFDCAGVGFVFTGGDPFTGVDLDSCINPETGQVSDLATHIIDQLQSYTALSQSGKGVHIIVKAQLPPGRRQGVFGGLYEQGRFFALTGHLFPGSQRSIEHRQAELTALHAELFPPPAGTQRAAVHSASSSAPRTDTESLDKMFAARNGAAVRRLWEGDISGYVSHSEADLALCAHLAFWTRGDASRIDAMFRQSGLYRAQKWDRQAYRERTIRKALDGGKFYALRGGTFPEKLEGRPSRIIVEVA